jgi:hypothetical protein
VVATVVTPWDACCCFRVVWFVFSPHHAFPPSAFGFGFLVTLEYESIDSKNKLNKLNKIFKSAMISTTNNIYSIYKPVAN